MNIENYPELQAFWDYTRLSDLKVEEMTSQGQVFEHPEMNGLFAFCQNHPDLVEEAIGWAGEHLAEMDTFKACATAICIGSITESGFDCHSDEAIVRFFTEMSWKCVHYLHDVAEMLGVAIDDLTPEQLEEAPAQDCYEHSPEGYKAGAGSYYLVMCVMTRICRKRELREMLRNTEQLEDLCNYLSDYWGWYGYVSTVLGMTEEETVTVLFPEKQTGVEVVARQIDSSFLFMTLFQVELSKTGVFSDWGVSYTYNKDLDFKAHNLPQESDAAIQGDVACLEYYTGYALQPDGSYSITRTDETGKQVVDQITRVWGEQPLHTLPRIDGRIVILADSKPLMNRTWGEGFVTTVHDALRPEITLQKKLTAAEYEEWMEKVRLLKR